MQNYHKILTEKEINDFVENRFESIKKSNKVKELVEFQATNKFLIMAHNQEQLKVLGRIVASNKKVKFSEILIDYENNLKLCLHCKPTIKTHSNVIMHIFGFFSKEFSELERNKFFDLLKDFKDKKIRVFGKTLGAFVSSLGGKPALISGSEQYLAYQRNTVDAGMTGVSGVKSRKLFEVMDTITKTNHGVIEFIVVANIIAKIEPIKYFNFNLYLDRKDFPQRKVLDLYCFL